MKFRKKLVLYYLVATIISVSFVGFAVLKGIEQLGMNTMEKQLIGESRLAEAYISQIAFYENPNSEGLDAGTAQKIINNLSLSLGNVRLYDKNLKLLASSDYSLISPLSDDENKKVLANAVKGNYAYTLHNSIVYFASSLGAGTKTIGVLEIVYPLSFLSNLMNNVTNIFFVGAAAFAVLMTILSIYIAGRITKPIGLLVSAAGNYANRNFTPVHIKSSDEIAQLCQSFNAMGAQLEDYIQRQKQFVSNVSHELRTPLTAIKGYSEYLSEEVNGNQNLERVAYHLNNESKRLSNLVDELLLVSRIDSGREDYKFQKLNLSCLLEETIEKMTLRGEKYGIRIFTKIEPNVYTFGDSEKLVQIFVNLLDNAFKFSTSQSSVQVKLYKEAKAICLSIEDHGIGIPQNEMAKIWERFYRAENAKGTPGTGLGLSIAKSIADAHKGSIELESGPHGGTTATLKLPALS